MPKRKSAYGARFPEVAGLIDANYLQTILAGGSVPREAVRWFLEISGQSVQPLPKDWLSKVEETLPASLDSSARQKLSELVHLLYFERLAFVRSIKEQALRKRLERIEAAALKLLDAIEIDGQESIIAWAALEKIEPKTLSRDDAYPVITMIINRAHRAKALPENLIHNLPLLPNPEKIWLQFTSGAMDFFRQCGGDVTITKRGSLSREPSAFCKFVWKIDRSLPREARQHSSDIWALCDALSDARTKLKQGL